MKLKSTQLKNDTVCQTTKVSLEIPWRGGVPPNPFSAMGDVGVHAHIAPPLQPRAACRHSRGISLAVTPHNGAFPAASTQPPYRPPLPPPPQKWF